MINNKLLDMNFIKTETNQVINEQSSSINDAYSCNYVNDCNTYSTSETNTGKKWIDGKLIYRKVFTGSSLPTGTAIGNIGNYQNVVLTDGYVSTVISGATYKHNIGSYLGTTFYSGVQYRPNGDVNLMTSTSYNNQPYLLIVEYTKTTN